MVNKKVRRTAKRNTHSSLPQNILGIGERVFEDKNIYIEQNVYKSIHKYTADKLTNESGGVLVGNVIEELSKVNIIIEGFIEARNCEATPTTLTFTHKTWDYVHTEIDKKYTNMKIIGWIHTHPNYGIFLSENDRFIQKNFFSDSTQIAYVIDPIKKEEGFFFWISGKIERCLGFYVYDQNGVKITINDIKDEVEEIRNKGFSLLNICLYTGIIFAFIILTISVITLSSEVGKLKKELQIMQRNVEQVINNQAIQQSKLLESQQDKDKDQDKNKSNIEPTPQVQEP